MIVLPWFPKSVHLNFRSRSHWARTRGLKDARAWAVLATRAASDLKPPADGPIRLVLTFYPPSNRARDKDGLMSACKAYFDGIAEAWGVDDVRFDPQPPVIAEVVRGGKIVVTLG